MKFQEGQRVRITLPSNSWCTSIGCADGVIEIAILCMDSRGRQTMRYQVRGDGADHFHIAYRSWLEPQPARRCRCRIFPRIDIGPVFLSCNTHKLTHDQSRELIEEIWNRS